MRSDYRRAAEIALISLRRLGIDIPARPTHEQVQAEYETLWKALDGRPIESLIELPLMIDPELQAAMQIFAVILVPAYSSDIRLYCVLVSRMVQISLRHGTSDASAYAFVTWGFILGAIFHRYEDGYRFAKLACDLVVKHSLVTSQAMVYVISGVVAFWTHPISAAIDFERKGLRAAIETGEPAIACLAMWHNLQFLLLRNDPLDVIRREADLALDFAREARFDDALTRLESHRRFIATMQGRTATFSTFSDAHFEEATFESRLIGIRMTTLTCGYWVIKLKARFLSGDYGDALAAAEKAKALLPDVAGQTVLPDYFYYAALTVSALYGTAAADRQQAWSALLTECSEQLREWTESNPPTYGDRHALVCAEIARLDGRQADAMRLYEQAIHSARENGFVQNEGVAYEMAARFYISHGFDEFADTYLRKARSCYLRWGADGKVVQLEQLYPHLAASEAQRPEGAEVSAVQNLDAVSVVKASQAVSSEIELPKLIERLMTIAIENAGADRGILILPSGDDYQIQAEARATGDQIEVTMRQKPVTRITCPESIIRYVIRVQESVILDNATKPNLFSGDDYLHDRQSKSILCLPLIKQAQLTGILLLENTLTSHAFTADRIAVLELLAAQAAISLENTRLYNDLRERETKVRRLVDSNIIGVLIGNLDGHVQEANQAFLEIVGYDRGDLAAGRLRRTELTPAEWHDRDTRAIAELRTTGTARPYEKEYFRKDRTRVPVLIGGARFDEQGGTVIFIVDLSERKRAEAELAHANRVAIMGQLTASIAHEVNQPLAALRTNAETAKRWLVRQPPNLEKAEQLIDHIVNDGKRATDIVSRIRDLSKKAPMRKESVEVNEAILDVMGMTRAAMSENNVLAKVELAKELSPISGDRVQLQQVILNLIMNAIEAMSAASDGSRELLISTARTGADAILVKVSNSGPGLPPINPERIFEAFYTTKASGLGMGLSICRTIVEAHGGWLWAEPNIPSGAVFCLTLPLIEPDREPLLVSGLNA